MKNEQIRQIEKKAYEIAYAMFRLSGNIGNRPIAGYLENHCLSFFDSAMYGNVSAANAEAKILEYYLRLGGDIGLIHQNNAEMLILEIGNLNSAIAEYGSIAGNAEPLKLTLSSNLERGIKLTADIQKMVRPAHHETEIPPEVINKEIEAITNSEEDGEAVESRAERQASPQAARQNPFDDAQDKPLDDAQDKPLDDARGKPLDDARGKSPQVVRQSSPQAIIRQSAILQRIRQSGNPPGGETGCRMKDIIEGFPEVSERTLRYDLERLSEQGLIERVGQSGPATSYRATVVASV